MEKPSLPMEAALCSNEWKAVPDIWRSSVEKYGDRIALVDPYHEPPSTFTYRQVMVLLEQSFLGRTLFVNSICNMNMDSFLAGLVTFYITNRYTIPRYHQD